MKSAAIVNAHHIPVLPHYYKDYDTPLVCSIPNGWGFNFIDEFLEEIK